MSIGAGIREPALAGEQDVRREQRVAVAHALASERRRVAADVHDLIMQDLSLALANARSLAEGPGGERASLVVAAGERALAGARRLMGSLVEQEREPIVPSLHHAVLAAARSTRVRFNAAGVPVGAEPDRDTAVALVHIGREAVTNAVKHAGASCVEVVLACEEEWQLLVRDDGSGFGPGAARGGFGIQSMRRQASELGGKLLISSVPGAGTTLRARLP